MTERDPQAEGRPSLTVVFPRTTRRRRRHLPWLIRYLVVLALGSSVGLLASYAIRKIGM